MAQPISVYIANLIQHQIEETKKHRDLCVSVKEYDKAHNAQVSIGTLERTLDTIDTFLDVRPTTNERK
jgi:Ca2+-binding EF-hand superfamily protein